MVQSSIFKLHIICLCVVAATQGQARGRDERAKASITLPSNANPLIRCKDCPEFVAVPLPPQELRRIRYVATYELTWKNFLAAVDARACLVPTVSVATFGSASKRYAQIDPAKYRIDWPISELTLADVECYLGWLQSKTKYKVALPSAKEWEWFARAGNPAARFPWGQDEGAGHEQLYGTSANLDDSQQLAKAGILISSRRVGVFSPNPWGIHDLMGNVRELTSDVKSSEECSKLSPYDPPSTPKHRCVLIKGSDAWSPRWAIDGIDKNFYVMISNGKYSAEFGLRIVLIDGA